MSEPSKEPPKEPSARSPVDPRPPADHPLSPAWNALDRGDWAEAKRLAEEVERSDDEALREQARAFLERMRPDPAVAGTFAATALLLLALALVYLGRR